ncbi:MAG TPA: right-handed parallel beta-helix repeat-containing protein, partial [Polyangiaceae bacterium]
AATRWRSAFQPYQDGNVQYGQRFGSGRFANNIVIGTGDLFVEFFPTVVESDSHSALDRVIFSNNYFADTSSGGVYTHADPTGVTIEFENNRFTGFVFNYAEVYPTQTPPIQIFGVGSNSPNPHLLHDNRYDLDVPFVKWTFPSVTQTNNTYQAVERVKFRDFMVPALDANYRRLEFWTDIATLSPDQRVVTYEPGDFVIHMGNLYEALTTNSSKQPDQNPTIWRALPAPADDVRLASDSPHAGIGIRWSEP